MALYECRGREAFETGRRHATETSFLPDWSVMIATAGACVTGDETLLRRAFTNLLRNAADAVEPGGRVRVSSRSGRGEVLVFVDDDGPGLPEEELERIFIPFVSGKAHGTGLGLALTRKVVVHHGGRIRAGRSPLGGARFELALPLRSEREANGSVGSSASRAGHEK